MVFLIKSSLLSLLFYWAFLILYRSAITIAALWSKKARQWIEGRKLQVPEYKRKTVWMHCASLGEFEQGRPLLEAIKLKFPGYPVVLTFFSPSGYEIRKNFAGADSVLYLPLDGRDAARNFIKKINPELVLWVKYEYWYYFLSTLKDKEIPVLLVSGIFRRSQPFFKPYGKLWRSVLKSFNRLFIQDGASHKLLGEFGLKSDATVSGDTRFDRVAAIASQFEKIDPIEKFCGEHRVVVAGSTWEEDDAEWVHYIRQHPEIRFIIAPHEVDEVNIKYVQKMFPTSTLFSKLGESPKSGNVLIINNIGMLSRLYRYAHVAYVGGGFRESGIHNVLEAAVYYKPVIFGPVYEKFREARELVEAGGAFPVKNAIDLENLLDRLFNDEEFLKSAGTTAGNYVQQNRGATQIIMNYIQEKRLLTN